jgi:putative Holliday junction resolvase
MAGHIHFQGRLVDTSSALPVIEQLMAFDFGTLRTGVAVGNRITKTATPLPTVIGKGLAKWPAIDRLVGQWAPQALVIGVPFHPDGASHTNTRRARGFARELHTRFKLPVFEVDERYSTTEALAMGATDPDGAAACIILEQLLRTMDL